MNWIRESISDENNSADIAYVSIGGLVIAMVASIAFLCAMSAVSYARCTQIVDVGQGVRSAVPCSYDPNPLGLAIAACLGAFGSPIAALAVYMGQTRRRPADPAQKPGTTVAQATVTTVPAEDVVAPPKPKRKGAMG
jgi:hypothetical protein